MAEQMLILVDERDEFLGKYAPKGRCHAGKGLHHRAFTILISNKKGEILLQKRKHKLWDGYWDLTNSHPLHKENGKDETYSEATRRCLKREWDIEFPLKRLFGFNYYADYGDFCENEYCLLLVGEYNDEVHPNPEVIYEYKWMPLEVLLEDIKIHPKIYTPWAIRALQELAKRKKKLKLN
jgi:isopentenyl-diphosphate delta-isomerase